MNSSGDSRAYNAVHTHERAKIALLVRPEASGTPAARLIRHVRKEVVNGLVPDYVCGPTTCALVLHIEYHMLHRDYVYRRIAEVRNRAANYRTRVLLVVIPPASYNNNDSRFHELQTMGIIEKWTVIACNSNVEAARYLETFRAFDGKSAQDIQGIEISEDNHPLAAAIRGITKADVAPLLNRFGTFKGVTQADKQQLRNVPGMGETKVNRLYNALHQPFVANSNTNNDSPTVSQPEPEIEEDDDIDDIAEDMAR